MIIDKLKNASLLVKSDKTLKVLNDELAPISKQLTTSQLDLNNAALDPDLSKDGKIFAGVED